MTSSDDFISKGVAHIPMDGDHKPESFVFVCLPGLSMLALSAAVEPLRIANQLTQKVLYRWETMSEDGENIRCSNGFVVEIDRALGETSSESFVFACSGSQPELSSSKRISDWTRSQWRTGRVVGGLCTGAYTLARAGILKNKKFTLHWENILPFQEKFPDLSPLEQLYTIDGRIMTCGGGFAATDLIVRLINQRHGSYLSQAVLDMCLHSIHRSESEGQRSSKSVLTQTRNSKLMAILREFDTMIEEHVAMDAVAERHNISCRQLERLFKKHIGKSPKRYLTDLRLERGRALLVETDLKVGEIAAACGFNAVTHFSKRFRLKYGTSPFSFRVGYH